MPAAGRHEAADNSAVSPAAAGANAGGAVDLSAANWVFEGSFQDGWRPGLWGWLLSGPAGKGRRDSWAA